MFLEEVIKPPGPVPMGTYRRMLCRVTNSYHLVRPLDDLLYIRSKGVTGYVSIVVPFCVNLNLTNPRNLKYDLLPSSPSGLRSGDEEITPEREE